MEPRTQYAKTSDGVSIAYWTMGKGITLVLTPGTASVGWRAGWRHPGIRRWCELLAERRKIVRFDYRGFGDSDRSASDHSLEARLLDLDAVVSSLDAIQVALLGYLQSAPVAIAYAVRHPERVSQLILQEGTARGRDLFRGSERDRILLLLADADWDLYTELLALMWLGWAAGEDGGRYASALRESATPEAFRAAHEATARLDVTHLLPQITSPTLVVSSRIGADTSRGLAARIPGARLVLLDGSGSRPAADPEGRAQAINSFLDESKEAGGEAYPPPPAALVTILFTDLTSSTALTKRLGDAKAQELVRAHNSIVREALAAQGGSEIKHTGDGIMASFPTASGALECAVAIQRGIAAKEDADLQIHVGLNAGEPVAEESDLFGTSVQLARRICDHAEAGQVLASDVVRQLAAGKGFLFADIGEVVPKGFDEPVRLYEVRWRAEGSP